MESPDPSPRQAGPAATEGVVGRIESATSLRLDSETVGAHGPRTVIILSGSDRAAQADPCG